MQSFSEMIKMFSPKSMVYIVTDIRANHTATRSKIIEKYIDIYWPPGVGHCINSIMKDIAKMPTI